MVQVPDFPPAAPWRPKKLIGSIWLSESPRARAPIHPHLLPPNRVPSLPPPPLLPTSPLFLLVAATTGTHMATPVWLQAVKVESVFVCVFVCAIYQGVWRQTGQPGPQLPPSCRGKCGQTGWHLCAKASRALREDEEGGRDTEAEWRKRGGSKIQILAQCCLLISLLFSFSCLLSSEVGHLIQ